MKGNNRSKRWMASVTACTMLCIIACGSFTGGSNPFKEMTITANAAASDFTADEAINWVKSLENKPVEYMDSSNYAQCVDLTMAYYNHLGVPICTGNANEYAWLASAVPSGWTRTQNGTPQKGDILVYANNGDCHVAIYESDSVTWHQNFDSHSYVQSVPSSYWYWKRSTYWGCIHPNFKTEDPGPDKPTLTVKAGTSSTPTVFSWGKVTRGDEYDVRIYNTKDEIILSKFGIKDTSYSVQLPNGSYYATVAAVNSTSKKFTFSDHTANFNVGNGMMVPSAIGEYNGHIYAVYPNNMTWDRAKEVCQLSSGHLVTINSKEENAFLRTLVDSSGDARWYWIGAERSGSSFKWTTGEKFSFSNWGEGEPNNSGDIENYAALSSDTFKWNDAHSGSTDKTYGNMTAYGFIMEIEELNPVQTGRYNGHLYYLYDNRITWTEANAYCKSLGGNLVTINDAAENKFVTSLIQDAKMPRFWIGINDADQNKKQTWISGETPSYTNWGDKQPDYTDGVERFGQILKNGDWNDVPNFVEGEAYNGFICEVDAPALPKSIQLEMGEKYTLPAQPGQVSYVSSDKTKLIVSKTGVITPVGLGTAYVTVMYSDDDIEQIKVTVTRSTGDVNEDGEKSVLDIIALQKWILARPGAKLQNSDAADMNGDQVVDAFDLALLKQKIIAQAARVKSDWTLASKVPVGAEITDVKFTYDLITTETKTSYSPTLDGMTPISSKWVKSGSGTHAYANYPGGFDAGNAYYKKYEKSALKSSETETAKRTVTDSSVQSYIYWHWNYLLGTPGPLNNRYVSDKEGGEYVDDGKYYTFCHFSAFESTTNLTEADSSGAVFKYDTGNYDDVSWWWFKLPVYKQTYTDYKKQFTYQVETVEKTGLESETDPTGQPKVGNVKKWVKYVVE